jgi:hypothetical protein
MKPRRNEEPQAPKGLSSHKKKKFYHCDPSSGSRYRLLNLTDIGVRRNASRASDKELGWHLSVKQEKKAQIIKYGDKIIL